MGTREGGGCVDASMRETHRARWTGNTLAQVPGGGKVLARGSAINQKLGRFQGLPRKECCLEMCNRPSTPARKTAQFNVRDCCE